MPFGQVKLVARLPYRLHKLIHWNDSRFKNLRNGMVHRRRRSPREVVVAAVAAAVWEVAVSIDYQVGMLTN
jgi:hypothetical protein